MNAAGSAVQTVDHVCQTTQEPPAATPQTLQADGDLEDLLIGLEADDLNDFDGLDDCGFDVPRPDGVASPSVDSFTTSGIAIGFATGSGRKIAPPSKAALARVSRLFAEDTEEVAEPEAAPGPPTSSLANKRPRLHGPIDSSPASLFTTGSGGAVRMPSRASLEKARRILQDEGENYPGTPADPSSCIKQMPSQPLFATESRSAAPDLNAGARARALAIFGDTSTVTSPIPSGARTPALGTSLFSTAAGTPASQISAGARARAIALLGDHDSHSRLPVVGPSRRNDTSEESSFQTPSRMPLRTTTNTFANRATTPVGTPIHAIDTKTPLNPHLGSFGRPGSSRRKSQKPFVTPFKQSGTGQRISTSSNTSQGRRSYQQAAQTRPPAKEVYRSVFDLRKPEARKTWRDAYLKPQYNTDAELKEMGLPDEIWQLNLSNAIYYQFIDENAAILNNTAALHRLLRDGAALVKAKWVDNHYPLILWKLAGMVRAEPSLYDDIWNWGTVIEQLKYRYEREYGAAQRPIIRRIQEHDSSAAVPMVLCVTRILRTPPQEDESGDLHDMKLGLELSDGWYRINAELDECLARAVRRGKITVGRKIAICGAKLDSGTDGEDVLEALEKSRLTLSANSTSLARWDTRLGVQDLPFVSKLAHLSRDGGPAALMDVIIERLFPIAYVYSGKDKKTPPWGEEEEISLQEAWKDKYAAESSRLQEVMRERVEKAEDLANILVSHAEDLPPAGNGGTFDSLDTQFDELLGMRDPMPRIRGLRSTNILALAQYSRGRMEQEAAEAQNDVVSELKVLCPERDVRSFRLVRIRDTHAGDRGVSRLGMLTVWEAKGLVEGTLEEGARYLVSNIVPGRQGDWSSIGKSAARSATEVYLHTRRDTRWQRIGP